MKFFFLVLMIILLSSFLQGGDDWTQKSPSSPPSARDRHAMAYIGDDKILLFGGYTGSKNGETWIYDLSANTWEQKSPSTSPGAREYHAMAYLGGDQVLLFGGDIEGQSHTSTTFIYDLSENTWTELSPANVPEGRRWHEMSYIADGKVILSGGQRSTSTYISDVWLFESSTGDWTVKSNPGFAPAFHSLCFIGDDKVLMAGIWADGYPWTSYVYDLSDNAWTQKANMSAARAFGDMVYIGNSKAMFFGGRDADGWYYNTTYIYDLNANSWSTDNNSTAPSQRIYLRMAETSLYGSGYIVLFGGSTTETRQNDTWTFGGADFPLPVELTSFTASVNDNNVVLNWETATEVNNYGFEIERVKSEELKVKNFTTLGFVPGAGNSNSPKSYSFTDNDIENGTYLYRLKQLNTDGSYNYSNEITAVVAFIPDKFLLMQNYPNPFNSETVIRYQLPTDVFVKMEIYSTPGDKVAAPVNQFQKAGVHTIKFDALDLPSGIYFCEFTAGKYKSVKKFIILR
ncbi:MAG: T9SS type A sorting domain-containing protein [Ignavibacteriaceae bacterium]|nr:T9SS type A sorting domain-containing protein [Ignavibacteriaceae bacterium]